MRFRLISVLALMMAILMLVLSGCGSEKEAEKNAEQSDKAEGGKSEEKDSGKKENENKIEGEDVFDGERFNEMLWGYYEAQGYEHTGSKDDTAEFLEGMKYIEIDGKEVAALPLMVQFGQNSHFLSSFTYDGEIYSPYTELGKTMFRKAYIEEVGDLTEKEFKRIEKLLQLDLAEVSFVNKEGKVSISNFSYEVEDDTVSFYEVEVDTDDYTVEIEEDPAFTCDFLHVGGKLIMAAKGVQRDYVAHGYQESARMLSFSGYALNEKNRYEDLDGFYFSMDNEDEDITVYVDLTGGESPVDAQMELDKETGEFTLSWTQRWINTPSGLDKEDDEVEIEGVIVPVEAYGFADYSGFFMFIDGTCYKYLMSLEEYEELRERAMEDAGSLTDSEKEDLTATKRDILAELVAAFKKEGIDATVDYTSGQVSLKSNFLFGTDKSDLSDKGVEYVNAFMRVYTSVVMKEEYAPYVTKIIVEGHTDTSGSYSHNLTLSQKRAESVVAQCISVSSQIGDIITAQGCSYDYPVYNDDGSVNMEQSRRVTFRFVLSAN
ncbi:MAG: OmpA family protein [Ruminococcaceae bacterium]|nr:OmpA family protein [Oscillospiraceae bacterium]